MPKIMISYEEYDKVCEITAGMNCKLSRLPTMEEIDLLASDQIGYFLSILTWLIECDSGIPELPETMQLREYIIDKLDEGMSDYMFFSKQAEEHMGKWKIDEADYRAILRTIETVDFLDLKEFPTEEQLQNVFLPIIKYSFGFLLFYLRKNRDKKASAGYRRVRKMADDHYELQMDYKMFTMTDEEYEKLCDSILKCPVSRGNWWPTMQEVKDIVIPNLSNCYDFILWILKTGPKPENEEEKEVVKTLRGIIKENTHITEKGAVTWL